MQQHLKRINGILETLNQQRYSASYKIAQCKIKKIDYNQRHLMHESSDHWAIFDCNQTWGGLDQHYCFKTQIVLPDSFVGNEVIVELNTGATDLWNTDNPQFIAYVNGKMICAMDMNHHQIVLTQQANKGESYEFGLYAYSNSAQNNNFLNLTVSIHQLQVEKLYYDIKVPFEAAKLLREDALDKIKTLQILNDAVNCLDLREVGSEAFYHSVVLADEFMKNNFYNKVCGHSEVTVHSIGHTHIDVAWKWPLRQTREKAIRSFSTVIDLMNRYPEYKFMSSQPQLYQFVKEDCPELYQQIKQRIAQGRWEVEGAMWLEADCNLTSGESLVRQILYGKKFFQDEFGKGDNIVLWLPDVFGYSAALPQILKKSGIKYFMTTKIGWNEYNQIPNDTMLWQGIDGSEILTYFITTRNYDTYPELIREPAINTTYNGRQNASQIMGTWQRYQNKSINQQVLTCYGFGDGGGGTTTQMLEESRRMELGIPGCPKTKQSFVAEFFEILEQNLKQKNVPKWCGELYLEFHRGTYTSMARNKKYNRLCEFKNGDAEFFSVLNSVRNADMQYPMEKLDYVWRLTMLNQFHDILPGTSIKEVYEESQKQYEEILEIDEKIILDVQQSIASAVAMEGENNKAAFIYNQLSFERSGIIELQGVEDYTLTLGGKPIACQKTSNGSNIYLVNGIAAKGYLAVDMVKAKNIGDAEHSISVNDKTVDTPFYTIEFNLVGEIASLYDKQAQRELIKVGQSGNAFIVFEDRPEEYDAWNIDSYYEEKSWNIMDLQEWKVIENGPIRTCIYLKRKFLNSIIEQVITLYNHSQRIDFKTTVDWKQQQLLLKVAFPLDIMSNKATYEIQYGNVERYTHRNTSWDEARFEVCAHKWADLSEFDYGVALLNDSKYGYDIKDAVMRMTLIKSGIFPNPDADKEVHQFTYALFPHQGDYRQAKVIQQAYDLNCPMYALTKDTNQKIDEQAYSLFSLDAENVFADTVKKAQDNEDIIIRMYEAYGKRTRVTLNAENIRPLEAWECDLMENKEKKLEIEKFSMSFEMKPFEIKTFRFHRA